MIMATATVIQLMTKTSRLQQRKRIQKAVSYWLEKLCKTLKIRRQTTMWNELDDRMSTSFTRHKVISDHIYTEEIQQKLFRETRCNQINNSWISKLNIWGKIDKMCNVLWCLAPCQKVFVWVGATVYAWGSGHSEIS